MAPRVKYLGPNPDGSHGYVDERGNSFTVPDPVASRAQLPLDYEAELLKGFETFKQQPPEVLESERQRYNAMAQNSRRSNPEAAPSPPASDELGRTSVRFPDAQRFDQLSPERVIGPLPGGERPRAQVGIQPGTGREREAAAHEALHVSAVQPDERPAAAGDEYVRTELSDAYARMSPRDREMYRVMKTLKNEDDPHAPHELRKRTIADLRKKLGL